jgi:hypothetical protein
MITMPKNIDDNIAVLYNEALKKASKKYTGFKDVIDGLINEKIKQNEIGEVATKLLKQEAEVYLDDADNYVYPSFFALAFDIVAYNNLVGQYNNDNEKIGLNWFKWLCYQFLAKCLG